MVDVLIFGPHPDDIEILAGGLALRLADQGYTVGGVDMTRGEAGTRGTAEQRAAEAVRGGELLGLSFRENLGLPDGGLAADEASRDLVIDAIRRHRPRLVVGPVPRGFHPDHVRTGQLLKDARFLAGCSRIGPPGEPWRPGRVLQYPSRQPELPDLVIDISAYHDQKMEAVRAHASQLFNPDSSEQLTAIASPGFLEGIEARTRYYGSMIGATHGEPFMLDGPIAVDDPVAAVRDKGEAVFRDIGAQRPAGSHG